MPIPENITEEHIRQAARYIDDNGVPPQKKSRFYDVIVDNTSYPPKYIISVANIYANKEEWPPYRFTADKALNFLERLNFKIIKKNQLYAGYLASLFFAASKIR